MIKVDEMSAPPSPGGEEAASLIDGIWTYFNARRAWPTYAEVDHQLYRAGRRIDDALGELTPDLILGIDSRGLMKPQPEQRLRLTIGGISTCSTGGDHVATFMLVLAFAVSLDREWDYAGGEPPRFTLEEVRPAIALRGGPVHGMTVLREVLSVIDAEPWSGGYGGDGDDRQFGVSRSIREFAGVKTFTEYWRTRDRLKNPDVSQAVAASSVPVQGSMRSAAVAFDGLYLTVHPLLSDALWLYRQGRMADAAEKALREVEARFDDLANGAGEPLVAESFGQRRMAAALNPTKGTPVLNVCHSEEGYDEGEQDGMKFLFMGLYAGLRNPIGHRRFRPTDADEVAEILGLASLCLRRLDTAQERLPGNC